MDRFIDVDRVRVDGYKNENEWWMSLEMERWVDRGRFTG